jgi:hypothetical protein
LLPRCCCSCCKDKNDEGSTTFQQGHSKSIFCYVDIDRCFTLDATFPSIAATIPSIASAPGRMPTRPPASNNTASMTSILGSVRTNDNSACILVAFGNSNNNNNNNNMAPTAAN